MAKGEIDLGRPPMFETSTDLQEKIDEYFGQEQLIPTITGLCYHLGFESRQSFYAYEKKEAFSYTVKRARLRIESIYEIRLHSNANAGSIFALKNFGWSDKQEVEHSGAINSDNQHKVIFEDYGKSVDQ